MKKILISLVAIVPALCAHGFDVFLYDSATKAEVFAATNAHTINFAQDLTTIELNDGTTKSVTTGTYDQLMFKKQSGIETIVSSISGISIVKDGTILTVRASAPIESLDIVTVSGVTAAHLSSQASSLSFDTASLTSGVYMVRVVSGNQKTVSKIIL